MNDNLVTFNGLQYLVRRDINNDGSISLKLEIPDGSLTVAPSINLAAYTDAPPIGYAFIKNSGECEGIVYALAAADIIEPTGETVLCGTDDCEAQIVFAIDDKPTVCFGEVEYAVERSFYEDGSTSLQLKSPDKETLTVTVCLANSYNVYMRPFRYAFLKESGEGDSVIDVLTAADIIEPTGQTILFGLQDEAHLVRVVQ